MDALSHTFAALADPTRRAILARLARGQAHVGEIGAPLAMSGPAVSHHLRVLERAGLIVREVDAQWRICRLQGPALRDAHDWLREYRQFWEASLDRLTELLETPAASPLPSKPPRVRRRSTRPTSPPPRKGKP
jgi:DNA-binding transcriptional ArsR family regulator